MIDYIRLIRLIFTELYRTLIYYKVIRVIEYNTGKSE